MTDTPAAPADGGPAVGRARPPEGSRIAAGGGTPAAARADAPAEERVVVKDNRKINVTKDGAQPAAAQAAATEAVQPPPEAEAESAESVHPAPEETEVEPTVTPAEEPVPAPLGAELEALRGELEERTNDLQRVNAEYANYRKRVERDKTQMAEQALGAVLASLLPILDDLDRAREHGDLVGPFGAVAEQLVTTLSKFGLTAFGAKGDPFDPTRHDAVSHTTSPEVTEPTAIEVMRRGYQLGDRLLRPALVAVADPE